MLAAVTAINKEVNSLAPVLNSPTVKDGALVKSSREDVPVATMLNRYEGQTYLFAVGMRNAPTRATFKIRDLPTSAVAEVVGENRDLDVRDGQFEDDFRAYDVHIYKIR